MVMGILKPREALNKTFLKVKPNRGDIDKFKAQLNDLLNTINDAESEEFHKNLVRDFLKETYYYPNHFVNTKGRNELVIHNGKKADSTVGVIIEAKKPTNKAEMLNQGKINVKALQALVLYYLRERSTHKNIEIKHLIASNIYEWFIFDATLFDRLFAQNKNFVKQFNDFEGRRLADTKTDFFYKQIAAPFIEEIIKKNDIEFTYFDISEYEKPLHNNNGKDDVKLIALFKLLAPEHLLKLPFANDSNSLDKRFYEELLHIVGLTETKVGSKKLIARNKEGERNTGSFLENAIIQLDSVDKISRLENPSRFGANMQERLFNLGLELSITWINRILFLKLLEAQLITYHKSDKSYEFLNIDKIQDYDDLNSLFFQVLACNQRERNEDEKALFSKVPFLNSSLFEPTDIEHATLFISSLRDDKTIPLFSQTVLKDDKGERRTGDLITLQYLFEFLSAYDFASEGSEAIQEDNKTLINASVLGLIFEKINGYKDGSFFTPGFITMYMCRETIRKAVLQKFNETKGWNCSDFKSLYNKIEDQEEANKIINDLKICDPAVGSGHFLVSALNEMIVIKSDLKILRDREGRLLKEYTFEVTNDELIVMEGKDFFYYNPANKESQRVQEALFHEKQTIIENCLFGVDINPNSVKICRLRLWIELLKNAYYKNDSELETLPNIDINIKCGNSLISRFALNADLEKVLNKSAGKWTINSYRHAVDTYRNAQSKEQKREMERLINEIKTNFRSKISQNDPKVNRLGKIKGELFDLTKQERLFERSKKEKADWNEKVKKLTADVKKLEAEIEEIKNNNIFENGFEWRFEFPEVLDDNGHFVGFDVVIGNPPYGIKLLDREKEFLNNRFTATRGEVEIYTFFIEHAMTELLKEYGHFSFITTNAIYYLDKFSQIRSKAFLENKILSLLELEKQVFADAPDIVPAIYVLQKNSAESNIIELYKANETKRVYDLIDYKGFSRNQIEQSKFKAKDEYVFSLSTNEAKENLITKLSRLQPIKESYKVVYGIKTGGNKRFVSQEITGNLNWKKCASSAKNISKYIINWQGDYLNVCSELAGLNTINYEQPKILIQYIRKLSMPVRLVCAIDTQGEYYPLNNFSFIVSENSNSLKVLLGILNSRLMNWYFSNCYVDYNIKPKYIERLPLPASMNSQELERAVENIVIQKTSAKEIDRSEMENKINKLVYKLYELTAKEIEIIESN